MNRTIVTEENAKLVFTAGLFSVDLQNWEEDFLYRAVKKFHCGIGWLPNFDNQIDVVANTGIEEFSCPRIWCN
jgi:peptide methionine sulfoxide reductase MsrB